MEGKVSSRKRKRTGRAGRTSWEVLMSLDKFRDWKKSSRVDPKSNKENASVCHMSVTSTHSEKKKPLEDSTGIIDSVENIKKQSLDSFQKQQSSPPLERMKRAATVNLMHHETLKDGSDKVIEEVIEESLTQPAQEESHEQAILDHASCRGQEFACEFCSVDLSTFSLLEKQVHLNVCVEDSNLDRMQRRNFVCQACGMNMSQPSVSPRELSKRLAHWRVCSRTNGITIASLRKDKDTLESDRDFDELLDAIQRDDCESEQGEGRQPEGEEVKLDALGFLMQNPRTPQTKKQRSARLNTKSSLRHARSGRALSFAPKPTKKPAYTRSVPGVASFTVDGFHFSAEHYFLTHFHSDHYGGLPYAKKTEKGFENVFNWGKIYCTTTTAGLIMQQFNIMEEYICIINVGQTILVEGVFVTAYEANHCPGAVMFLFHIKRTKRCILHTGDCRYDRERINLARNLVIPSGCTLHTVFVDTTYCDPRYTTISQKEAVSRAVQVVQDFLATSDQARLMTRHFAVTKETLHSKASSQLLVFGSYTIGKERFVFGVVNAYFDKNEKIYVSASKMKILKHCGLSLGDLARLTTKREEARIYLTEMNKINPASLQAMLAKSGRFTRVLAFRPTGWAQTQKQTAVVNAKVNIVSIPYSEHSSFLELRHLVADLRTLVTNQTTPLRFVAAVGGQSARQHLASLLVQ